MTNDLFEIDKNDIRISSCSTREQHDVEMIVSIFRCEDSDFLYLYDREHRFKWVEVDYTDCNGCTGTARMCTEYCDTDYFLNKCVVKKEYDRRVGRFYSGKIWRDDILPFPVYLRHRVNASTNCDYETLDNFLNTSYLADGVTSIKRFLSDNERFINHEYASITNGQSDFVDS